MASKKTLKVKIKKPVCLIGYSCCGKSYVVEYLNKYSNIDACDIDDLIKRETRRTPAQHITKHGENYLRKIEYKIIKREIEKNQIIGLGAGAIENKKVRTLLQSKKVVTIYLDTKFETCSKRNVLAKIPRPLFSVDKYNVRKPLYKKCANHIIATDKITKSKAVSKILSYLYYSGVISKKTFKNVLLLNGPNMNMIGSRDQKHYGRMTYDELVEKIRRHALKRNCNIVDYQSNIEGKLVSKINKAPAKYTAVIINPAAFSHYSVAIRDAIEVLPVPSICVHMSDINNREEFRKNDMVGDACTNKLVGRGYHSYTDAITFLNKFL
ncbi:MAG: type II 3-dehydroquinate dehydratase [Coriobacteriales bacterium]|nr:type II 3-dehydroquinate dehydratase [Coriobacteriales bacterium]